MQRRNEGEVRINFSGIQTQPELSAEIDKALNTLHHIFLTHWEISPDSAKEAVDLVWEFMMAFAGNYSRLLMEGKIPDDKKLVPQEGTKRVNIE